MRFSEKATREGMRVTRGRWSIESVYGSKTTALKVAAAATKYDAKTGLVRPRRVQRKSSGWAVMVKR